MWRKETAPVRDEWPAKRERARKTPNSLFLCSLVSAGTSHWANPTTHQSNGNGGWGMQPFPVSPPGHGAGHGSLGTNREKPAQKLYKYLISRLLMVLSVHLSDIRCQVSTRGTLTPMQSGGQWYPQSFIFGVLSAWLHGFMDYGIWF